MKLVALAAFVGATALAAAQPAAPAAEGSPTWIVESFFTQEKFPNADRYYTGEMRNHVSTPPMGAYIHPGYKWSLSVLKSSDDHQIYRVTYSESPQAGDWYAYLDHEGNQWKLSAVRTLAIPPFVREVQADLQRRTVRTPKEELELQNMNLMFSSDAELKRYAVEQQSLLTRVAEKVLAGANPDELKDLLAGLKASFAELSPQGFVQITIGGVLDNSVGFIWVPEGKSPPAMSPNGLILIEPIAPGWFLFKTT